MSPNPVAMTVASLMPRAKEELTELVAFKSVADFDQFPREESEGAARWIADALSAEGFQDVALLDTPDGTQSVYGYLPGPEGARTVLLYAHYDVQPPLDESGWATPPFELTERDGRWYGRGAADCKGGVIMHLLALRALKADGGVPVNVKVIVEGSEEQGTGGLERYAEEHPDLLTADAVVIGDAGNFRAGLPTVTTTLRGMTMVRVRVDTLEGNLHSGQFGGAAPDALAALVRVLDSLRAEDGSTTVDGLSGDSVWEGLRYDEEQFRTDAKVLDGVELIGSGTVADRIWARPAVTVLGIDCPPVVGATPSVQASARALISLRVPPGVDAAKATELLRTHVESHTPWGARVSTEQIGQGQAFRADPASPAYQAMADAMAAAYPGQEMQYAGQGGSIPLCNTLAELYPNAEILLTGLSEPEAQIHAVNERVARRAGAAVGRGGPVPAQLRGRGQLRRPRFWRSAVGRASVRGRGPCPTVGSMDVVELLPGRLLMLRFPVGQAYLWRDGGGGRPDELTLVDAGPAGSGAPIVEAVTALGSRPADVRRVVLTHFHEDHAGGAAEVAALTGAGGTGPPPGRAPRTRRRTGTATGPGGLGTPLRRTALSLLPPGDYERPASVTELSDGDVLDVAGGAQVLHVPGHTRGSIALRLPRYGVLFTGDTVAVSPADGTVIPGVFNLDRHRLLASCRRLAALDTETACFGHGDPVLADASRRLRATADAAQRETDR